MIKLNDVEIVFEKFPNGETRIDEVAINQVASDGNQIKFKYGDDSDLIKLLFLKEYINDHFEAKNHLQIYYMPYSRMDRVEGNSAFTLKYVTDFINRLSFDSVEVIEPHSNVTPALLNKVNSNYINNDLIKKVIQEINFNEDVDSIMFPDNGASQRYKNMKFKNVLIGNKTRNFQTGEITGLELIGSKHSQGKKVLICDDLSSYGGTFVKSSIELKKEGFEEVYLLVAHAENSIFKGELFNHIDKLFTTDSILTEQDNWENQKFKNQLVIYKL